MIGLYSTGATDLKDIFLAPLEAVITADIDLSKKISDFIIRYGFEKNDDDKAEYGQLKMVSFTYINNKGKKENCSLPVLSLIQLPLLCIKDANFDMRVKMISTDEKTVPQPPHLLGDGVFIPPAKKTLLKAYITPDNENISESIKANMKVKLRMGQSDMPGGLIKLLSMINEITDLKQEHHE